MVRAIIGPLKISVKVNIYQSRIEQTLLLNKYIWQFLNQKKTKFISEFKKSGKCFSNNFDIFQWQLTQQSTL